MWTRTRTVFPLHFHRYPFYCKWMSAENCILILLWTVYQKKSYCVLTVLIKCFDWVPVICTFWSNAAILEEYSDFSCWCPSHLFFCYRLGSGSLPRGPLALAAALTLALAVAASFTLSLSASVTAAVLTLLEFTQTAGLANKTQRPLLPAAVPAPHPTLHRPHPTAAAAAADRSRYMIPAQEGHRGASQQALTSSPCVRRTQSTNSECYLLTAEPVFVLRAHSEGTLTELSPEQLCISLSRAGGARDALLPSQKQRSSTVL